MSNVNTNTKRARKSSSKSTVEAAEAQLAALAPVEPSKAELARAQREAAATARLHDEAAQLHATANADGTVTVTADTDDLGTVGSDASDASLASDLAALDDAPMTAEQRKNYDQRMREMGPAHGRATQFRTFNVRIGKLLKLMGSWDYTNEGGEDVMKNVRACLNIVSNTLDAAANQLESIPRSWRPGQKAGAAKAGPAQLVKGGTCSIRENVRKQYADCLEDGDFDGLTVVALATGRVVAQTKSGMRINVPRGHVTVG